eukprot:Nk52_evm24s288 gene=Nk52_evmTU24s288
MKKTGGQGKGFNGHGKGMKKGSGVAVNGSHHGAKKGLLMQGANKKKGISAVGNKKKGISAVGNKKKGNGKKTFKKVHMEKQLALIDAKFVHEQVAKLKEEKPKKGNEGENSKKLLAKGDLENAILGFSQL